MRSGVLTSGQLHDALATQAEERKLGIYRQLGQQLVEQGQLTEPQLRHVIAGWLGNRVLDPSAYLFDQEALALVPHAFAEREAVLPLLQHEDILVLAMADPLDKRLLDELRFMTQRRIVPVLAAPGTLMPSVARAYERQAEPPQSSRPKDPNRASSRDLVHDLQAGSEGGNEPESDVVSESDNTLVRLINSLIAEAITQKASDIHIETQPAPRKVRIRFRLDGELRRYLEIESRFRYAMIARIKIMAGMDISEHRKPQDGKIDFSRFGGSKTELRVVTVPTCGGLEDVVLRLLAGSRPMPVDSIGLSPCDLVDLRRMVLKPYGLILVCGPTGSGKTTTLHSLISDINTEDRKIWTAEDPIEITQDGLRQVQMNPRIGWSFAAAMRTFLRADPDVIMIGEMRDEETARIAIEASLTGHLVLSTLHTNSAPESIARLLEIGLDPFNFSDSLLAILAQRLVRRLCQQCVETRPARADEIEALAHQYLEGESHGDREIAQLIARWRTDHGRPDASGARQLQTHVRHGCEACEQRGYKGRLGIYELMLSDDAIRHHIRRRASAGEVRQSALAAGMHTLRQDGIEKVVAGLTDLAEVIAATNM
ncbi:GspE/PulE family protein [Malikia sp.]|uniref:GspE/PulE family protein n=1 Tax=Malikia sp. TaxID=2070706 RepID=UPI00262628F6|nr:GspE/PulE family protein [Malikia sp.]MDD2729752.1 GspE/PulE family protein [Malikia sp.]